MPDVDDERKPDSPRDLTGRSWTLRAAQDAGASSATTTAPTSPPALTYYAVLALFPAAIA